MGQKTNNTEPKVKANKLLDIIRLAQNLNDSADDSDIYNIYPASFTIRIFNFSVELVKLD